MYVMVRAMVKMKASMDRRGMVTKPKNSMYLLVQETPSSQVASLTGRIL